MDDGVQPNLGYVTLPQLGQSYTLPSPSKTLDFVDFPLLMKKVPSIWPISLTETWQEVPQGLQQALHFWEGGLRASGGAIVQAKTSWNLTSFKWNNGDWRYQT